MFQGWSTTQNNAGVLANKSGIAVRALPLLFFLQFEVRLLAPALQGVAFGFSSLVLLAFSGVWILGAIAILLPHFSLPKE